MQDLEKVRGLREGEIILQIDNGERVTVIAVGTYSLQLSSEFSLILKYYFYILVASKNLIFVSILAQDNYNFYFNKNYA